jgi:hypothetical protein
MVIKVTMKVTTIFFSIKTAKVIHIHNDALISDHDDDDDDSDNSDNDIVN